MNQAARARANAISIEAKKDGLRQRQSGDWVLSLVVASTDMDARLTSAAMGTRYQAVLVEVGDDEAPVEHQEKERRKWRDLGPVKQCGIRCADPVFWAFLRETQEGYGDVVDEASAADAVRALCCVLSRSDLGVPGNDGKFLWLALDNEFQAWKAANHG